MKKSYQKKLLRSTIRSTLEVIDTPIALSIYLRMQYNVKGLPDVKPEDYTNAQDYLEDAQALALVKKNPYYIDSDNSARANCVSSFLACEEKCKSTNRTLPDSLRSDFGFRSVIETARHYCHRILGRVGTDDPFFGPGATFSLGSKSSDLISKFSTLPECTPRAHNDVFKLLLTKMPHYCLSSGIVLRTKTELELVTTKLPTVPGNRFSTVPKTVATDRPIGVEPLGNMLLQKAYGARIRRKLKAFGLDLDTTAEKHRNLIKFGNFSRFATIDLSSASDTIATSLVKAILPDDWFDALNDARCHYTYIDGKWLYNHKFSSMGNGFTFELETLLFYTICLAIREIYGKENDIVSVFGDDMIVSRKTAANLITSLEKCGFSINKDKTFIDGPFRESCGTDGWYDYQHKITVLVRPTYVKSLDLDMTSFHMQLFNRIYAIAYVPSLMYIDERYLPILRTIRKSAKSMIGRVITVPHFLGDTGFHPLPGYRFSRRCLFMQKKSRHKSLGSNMHVQLACLLYGIPSHGVVPRGSKYTYTVKYMSLAGLGQLAPR